ncbi:flagellar M-ring protein FliF [Meinhardsimonia xiamenensis]|uniref:Flagellar M-ring protein n=1 Tax=Meinhardsimonia xiamenensis TaxID=990712 RepID=A0A1G9EAR5_9RHOB|nr:flagellar M-ring protein FliF [Meinhardsimonia xiamenensis]SDK73250.1 flagellar M-ring protein FliF [Meinhardsimonia xiamenensis]
MQEILSRLAALDMRRRVVLAVAALAMLAAFLGILRIAAIPERALLYAGLEPGAAGEVIAALEQRGVAFEVRGEAIFVPVAERDALRMALAAEGLPANSPKGYELLDSLTGFGTTSQMFDAAYWRAKEGELARTILASPGMRSARVHISSPSTNPFRRDVRPTASASVVAQSRLSPAQARAIRYLIASAVAGLTPEDVSVIDAAAGVVVTGDDADEAASATDRAERLRRNIERILEARVGPGRAVVEVSVETERAREAITERRFDPEGRVAISSDTRERTSTSQERGGAAVTVASNLPDGDAGGDEASQAEDSETREIVNYEVSEIRREVVRAPGSVRRISVAVLVDGIRETDPATGEIGWRPRSEEELAALRELVASAVGFDADRGDTITLKSMEFPPLEPVGTEAAPTPFALAELDLARLVPLAVLALVALVLGLGVVRPILAARGRPEPLALTPRERAAPALVSGAGGAGMPREPTGLPATEPAQAIAVLPFEAGEGRPEGAAEGPRTSEDPVERLRTLIEARREETVRILRSWMDDHEEAG